jgi:hypothetical protein
MAEIEQHDELMAEIERRAREQEERILYERYLNERRRSLTRRALLVAILTTTAAGVALNYFYEPSSAFQSQIQRVLGLLLPLLAVGVAALTYLQPTSARRSISDAEENFARTRFYLEKRLDELRGTLGASAAQAPTFSDADRAKVLASIQAKLESEALSSYVAGIQELVAANVKRASVEQLFTSISDRLGREVQDQARRGNLNLILGILTTLIGLTVLGYSVFYAPAAQATQEILAYFVPRVSLVILIEVFAYFFLRLYKQSLSEIKYFQNEITNVQSRHLAIQFSSKDPDAGLQLKIVEELMKTERNFLMPKDQTTIDIERERLSRSTYSELINAIKGLGGKRE